MSLYVGPIYDHDITQVKYRFSKRHDGMPDIAPGTAEKGCRHVGLTAEHRKSSLS